VTVMERLLSVIVPCHNSRRDYLSRTLAALREQTLPQAQWALVVVDNASDPPLSEWVDVAWHENGRLVREEKLGLVHARLRGLAESTGKLVVFVDDDNELAPDYLAGALRIATEKPLLGVFGGSVEPLFDATPPSWTEPYWEMIAIRPAMRSVWSNDIEHWESTPCGAGMIIRREVLEHYAREAETNPMRLLLGRAGGRLLSGEDDDLVITACSMGFGKGRFRELKLRHLIPASRLTADYLSRLYEGNGYSSVILSRLWNRADTVAATRGFGNLMRMGWRRCIQDWRQRRMLQARRRGIRLARQMLEQKQLSAQEVG